MKSYSQFQEDSWILKHLPLPTKGTFIEVGAYDGVASSNTYGFEQEGWTGVCVEPDPEIAERCRRNRSCKTLQCAIGSHDGSGLFYVNKDDRGQSGLVVKSYSEIIVAKILRLDFVIDTFLKCPIDLLSIDTEGTELDVWDSIGGHRPYIVIMEFLTWGRPPRDKEIVDRMLRDGYREAHRTEANLIFQRT